MKRIKNNSIIEILHDDVDDKDYDNIDDYLESLIND